MRLTPLAPMPIQDSMFLIGESRNAPMHVGSLQLFEPPEGSSGPEALRATYDRLMAHTEVGSLFAKRARRNLASGGQWAWERDGDVDLEHHVRRSALPIPGRPRELLELVGRLHSTLLDRNRPLWEMHLIEGMADGRFAIYTKLHHSVADGVTALGLTHRALSADPDDRDTVPIWAPRGRPEPVPSSILGTAKGLAGSAAGLARDLAGFPPLLARTVYRGLADQTAMLPFQAPRSILNTGITGSRRFAAQSWPLSRIKAVAKLGDGTVNDVVLAMSAGALRRYLLELDALPDAPLVAMVPVALKTGQEQGNAVGSLLCNLGTHLPDPAARLVTIQQSMLQSKAGLAGMSPTQVTLLSAGVMLPAAFGGMIKAHDVTRPAYNLVISNVPGGRKPLYFDGARLESIYPLSIPQEGQALNITVIGNGDQIGFGLIGCRRTLPSLQRMLGHLEDELAALETALA